MTSSRQHHSPAARGLCLLVLTSLRRLILSSSIPQGLQLPVLICSRAKPREAARTAKMRSWPSVCHSSCATVSATARVLRRLRRRRLLLRLLLRRRRRRWLLLLRWCYPQAQSTVTRGAVSRRMSRGCCARRAGIGARPDAHGHTDQRNARLGAAADDAAGRGLIGRLCTR